MKQLPIQLHNLPINLVLISNGMVGFNKLGIFPTLFDWDNNTIISQECLVVKGEEFLYNRGYKITENLKQWLLSLELENPFEEYYED